MRRSPAVLLCVLALSLPLLVAAVPGPAGAARGAQPPTVHHELRADLAALVSDAAVDAVVTAWDRAGLAALEDAGVSHHRLQTMPIALARLTAAQLDTLAGDHRLRSVWPVEAYDLLLDEGTAMVGADRVALDLGIDGEGAIVGIIDTGIDTTHPDLDGDKVLGNFQVVGSSADGNLLVPLPFTDDHGHGTHVASTVAGHDETPEDGDLSGVAPGAQLYGYAINAGTSVLSNLALVAFDDLLQRRLAGENIVAASNSWGGGAGTYTPDDPLAVATRALFENGIVPVFAAGNSGPGLQTASVQCTIPWTFCVGAITKGRTLAGFSSRGRTPVATTEYEPTEDPQDEAAGTPIAAGNHDVVLGQQLEIGVYRPNVSAPGVDIEAACSTAAGCPGGYQLMSGTSMATPHVSGVIALVQSASLAARGELLDASTVTRLVENTANRMPGYELWEVGTGEVDALEAVSLVAAAGDGELIVPLANPGATGAAAGEPTGETFQGQVLTNSWETGQGAYVDTFEVSQATGKITALLTWPRPTDNIYLNLYAPGLVPGEDPPTAQSAGLLDGTGPYLRGYRELDVHFPQPGTWHLEVHGRANVPTDVTVEVTQQPITRPTVTIDELTDDRVAGTTDAAALATSTTTGVTRSAITGTAEPLEVTGTPTPYWLHTVAGAADGVAGLAFTGNGLASFDTTEPTAPVSKVSEMTPLANGAYAGNFLTAYWRGQVPGAIAGDVEVTLHLSAPTGPAFTSNLTATLFAVPTDYQGVDEATVLATAATEAAVGPDPTEVTLTIPDVLTGDLAGGDVVLQLLSTYVDTGHIQVWHDSTLHPSGLVVPVLDPADAPLMAPAELEVTDGIGGGAELRWTAVQGAASYVVERAAGPTGPFSPAASASGTSHLDPEAPVRAATYYRVRSIAPDGAASAASAVAYATPVDDAATVEVRFGAGPWEAATLTEGRWVYERIAGTDTAPAVCELPDPAGARAHSRDRGNGNANGKGQGTAGDPADRHEASATCAPSVTTVSRHPLPEGDVAARAGRWFTVSPEALQSR